MKHRVGFAFVLLAALGGAACGRRVVIDPDDVPRHNTPGWVVRRAPTVIRVPPEPPPGADAESRDAGVRAR